MREEINHRQNSLSLEGKRRKLVCKTTMPETTNKPNNPDQPQVDFDQAMNMRFEFKVPLIEKLMQKLGRRKRDEARNELTQLNNDELETVILDPMSPETLSAANKTGELITARETRDLQIKRMVDNYFEIQGVEVPHAIPEAYYQSVSAAVTKEQSDKLTLRGQGLTEEFSDMRLQKIEQHSKTVHAFYEAVFLQAKDMGVEVNEQQVQAAFELGRKISEKVHTNSVRDYLSQNGTVTYDSQIGGYYSTGAADIGRFLAENEITDKETQTVLALAYCSGAIENGAPSFLAHYLRDWLVDIRTEDRKLGDFVTFGKNGLGHKYSIDWASKGISNPELFLATHDSSKIVNQYSKMISTFLDTNGIDRQQSKEWKQYLSMYNAREFNPNPSTVDYPPTFEELKLPMANEPLNARDFRDFSYTLSRIILYVKDRRLALKDIGQTEITDSDIAVIKASLENMKKRLEQPLPVAYTARDAFDRNKGADQLLNQLERLNMLFPNRFEQEMNVLSAMLPTLNPMN